MSTLYGILVGIDHYPPAAQLSSLTGCRNDIRHWEQILKASAEGRRLEVQSFTDEEATYGTLTDAFAQAASLLSAGDHFCFVFCGHGSREPAAKAFRPYFPDGLQETLLCYDSRLPGGLALADKELAWLLQDIADRGAEITVVLDCCHAGSGTRNAARADGTRIRRAPDSETVRPIESYLGGRIARQLETAGTHYRQPTPSHVLLAACDRREEATELPGGRGLLSSAVEQALSTGGQRVSYLDLHRRTLACVLGVTDRQHPKLEAVGGADAYRGFLGTALSAEHARVPVTRLPSGELSVPLGAAHGLAGLPPHEIRFQLFRGDKPWELVSAQQVGFGRTDLPASVTPPGGDDLTALLVSIPPPPAFVYFPAADDWGGVVEEVLAAKPSAFYSLSPKARLATYRLEPYADGLAIIRQGDAARAYAAHGGVRKEVVRAVLHRLNAIMEWEYLVGLGNNRHDDATPGVTISLELPTDTGWQELMPQDRQLTAVLPSIGGQLRPLPFRLRVRNTDPRRRLHVSLFIGTEGYGFFDTGYHEALGPGETAIAWDTLPDRSPTRFVPSGKACTYYRIKCFVGEEAMDATGLQRDGVPFGEVVDLSAEAPSATRGGIPGLDGVPYRAPAPEWWGEHTLLQVLENSAQIGQTPVDLLAGQLKVAPRKDAFSAAIVITAPEPPTVRAVATDPLADWLATAQPEVFSFRPAGRGSGERTVIELSEIKGAELLKEDPLELHFAGHQPENTYLQAFVHDGEHLLPVGEIENEQGDQAVLRIAYLPETTGRGKRSALGAVRMVIQKFILRGEGHSLRWVDYSGLVPRRREDGLRGRVASASRILLVVHGIIGDTRGLAAFGREFLERGDFDLVLTFDYENLVTPLEDTSKELKKALQTTAGIREDQYLVILAHSMGGLVARHYIENRKGKLYVDRLVMAGTPNAGSGIAKLLRYRKYAIALLGFAMNYGWAPEALGVLLAVLERTKFLTPTLEQMDPDSTFLDGLYESADPNVPYYVLAGDLNDFFDRSAFDRSLQDKLFKLGGRLFYGTVPNDLAVTVESIHTVPGKRIPGVLTEEIACHHMNYFVEPGSADILRTYLTDRRI